MAVRPEKVIEKDSSVSDARKNMQRAQIMAQLESLIDENLMKRVSDTRAGHPILMKIGDGISDEIRQLVVQRYQSQDWKVEIIKARGGDCFRFTPAKTIGEQLEYTAGIVFDKAKQLWKRLRNEQHD